MDTNTSPRTGRLSPARLVIHAEGHVGARGRRFEPPFQRLRAVHADDPRNERRVPLNLQIDDLQGLRVHSFDDAGPLIDVHLPAGTYHVTVHFGSVRRRYTMTLEPGVSFDLYPRLVPDIASD